MRILQEWAEHYKKQRIWVYPYKDYSEKFQWLHWRNMTDSDYDEEFLTYDWDSAEGINVVTGKKGVLILTLAKDKNIIYATKVLLKVLTVLGLPHDYKWVIEGTTYFSVILDVHSMPVGSINKKYKDFNIHYEDSYILPPSGIFSESHFKNGIPYGHPEQLSWKTLSARIEEIKEIDIVYNPNSKKNIRKKKILIACSILFGIIAIISMFYIISIVTSGEQLNFLETTGVLALIATIFIGGAIITKAFD